MGLRPEEVQWALLNIPQNRYAVINPGAAYGFAKLWLPERFASVAYELVDRYGFSIVLSGGPAEEEVGHDIEAEMNAPCLNVVGQTGVRELMAILADSGLMITNDSGQSRGQRGVPVNGHPDQRHAGLGCVEFCDGLLDGEPR